jgi:anti-sigma regulatory factor (Ser/Thr protein kinase)
MRRWLSSLLPQRPARDDLLAVATELGSNALEHTASGQEGGWFAVELTWHQSMVQVVVADCGGPAEPKVISDPDGERGRGLLLVRGLSLRIGWTGDERGRLVWAQIAWADHDPAESPMLLDPNRAAVQEEGTAPTRRFAGVPAWFGRSILAWRVVAGSHGLVSAAPAPGLGALYRLLDIRVPATATASLVSS